jgi:hypothetical protein
MFLDLKVRKYERLHTLPRQQAQLQGLRVRHLHLSKNQQHHLVISQNLQQNLPMRWPLPLNWLEPVLST